MQRFSLLTLVGLCSTLLCHAQLAMTVKEGANKWGYAGANVAAMQRWNGGPFTVETCVQLPTHGNPGALPRESWFGFIVLDDKHGFRYCPGMMNMGWNPNPSPMALGVARHEAFGNWKPLSFAQKTLANETKQAWLRLSFHPAAGDGTGELTFAFSNDGTAWNDVWKYATPTAFAPNYLGLTADSYAKENSFGPVTFLNFTVTGTGPAVSDRFTGALDGTKWLITGKDRGDIAVAGKEAADTRQPVNDQHGEAAVSVRFTASVVPDDNGFVFVRNREVQVQADLHTSVFIGKTVKVIATLTDAFDSVLASNTQQLTFDQPTKRMAFPIAANTITRNGIYRLTITGLVGNETLPGCFVQFAVVDDRPIPRAIDTASPYMYCHLPNTNAIRLLGAVWGRGSWFGWDVPRKQDGTFDFAKSLDARFAACKEKGISLTGPICGPRISNELPASIEKYVQDHVDLIFQARERYGEQFRMVEIGNEPENWPVTPVENEWILMARAQAEITRRVHQRYPDIKIMSTGTTHVNLAFLGQLAAVGGPDAADIIGVHGYRSPSAPEYGHTQDVQAIKSLFPGKSLWCNEQAYFARSPLLSLDFDNIKGSSTLELDEDTQAIYLPRLLLAQLAAGYDGVCWYGGYGEREGLFFSPTYVRPGACAYAALTNLLPHPKFLHRLTPEEDDIWALQFSSDGQAVTALWSLHGAWRVTLPSGVADVRDMYGNPLTVEKTAAGVAVLVSQAPIYCLGSLDRLGERQPVSVKSLTQHPLVTEEREQLQPVVLRVTGVADSLAKSHIRVIVRNTTAGPVRGTVELRMNDSVCNTPWPAAWHLVPVTTNAFQAKANETVTVDFTIVSSDPALPFDPYHPGPGFYAKWWATGYYFAARATLSDGTKVNLIADRGVSLRGAPKLPALSVDGKLDEWR
ncbi:MAG TPA: hypothetical protein VHV83_18700, partial [Armatimonadota bacterium]|nr:hypothetical protein [Armatimonadota bacterium]